MSTVPAPKQLAVDSCCLINLHHSGIISQVLQSLAVSAHVTEDILNEIRSFDARQYLHSGILILDTLTEHEENTFINLASSPLGNGECVCGALAIHRDYAIATDDYLATQTIRGSKTGLVAYTTPQMIWSWSNTTGASAQNLKQVILDIEDENKGNFQVRPGRPFYNWWRDAAK